MPLEQRKNTLEIKFAFIITSFWNSVTIMRSKSLDHSGPFITVSNNKKHVVNKKKVGHCFRSWLTPFYIYFYSISQFYQLQFLPVLTKERMKFSFAIKEIYHQNSVVELKWNKRSFYQQEELCSNFTFPRGELTSWGPQIAICMGATHAK